MGQLTQFAQHNFKVMGTALAMNDGHCIVLRRALFDAVAGNVRTKEVMGAELWDVDAYYDDYRQLLDAGAEALPYWLSGAPLEEAIRLGAEAKAAAEAKKDGPAAEDATLVAAPGDPPGERVFGGDYGQSSVNVQP